MSNSNKIDYAPSDIDVVRRNMSDSDINGLIDVLCSARADNPDVVLMDSIQGQQQAIPINPIEQEKIALRQDSDSIEDELVRNIFENNWNNPLSIEEINELKAKGIYDRYMKSKSKGNIQEENTMSDIEAEIKANMNKELPGGIENITEVIEEKEEVSQEDSFQSDGFNKEDSSSNENINTGTSEEAIRICSEIADNTKKTASNIVFEAGNINDYLSRELTETIDEIISGKAIEKIASEANKNDTIHDFVVDHYNNSSIEDCDNKNDMSIEDFNDVPATELNVSDEDITEALMNQYDNVSFNDATQLISVMNRYKAGEKFNVFDALPNSLKAAIMKEAASVGANRSTINFFAKSFINDLVNNTYLDKEIHDFNEELKEALEPMNNIAGTLMDEYSDEVYDKFTTQLEAKAKEIKDEDPEKAAQLLRISTNFNESLSLVKIIDVISRTPSNINKAYKMARDNWNRVLDSYNEAISNVNPAPRPLDLCLGGLINAGYPEDYSKTLVVLVADSIKEAIEKNVLEEHIYAYYLSNALYNMTFTTNKSNTIKILTKSIDDIVSRIDEYMTPLKARNKKNRKKKRK